MLFRSRDRCRYEVKSFFDNKHIKNLLSFFFPSLLEKNYKSKLSSTSSYWNQCPPINKEDVYNYYISLVTSNKSQKNDYSLKQIRSKKMSREEYKKMSQKLAVVVRQPWDDGRVDTIDPQEEMKKAFLKMSDAQLNFHLHIPGKNREYAKAILNHRKNKKM